MGRIARVVLPGYWHHVTQRGNHQQPVFFGDGDRRFYLGLLRHYCGRESVRITGYCLMGNHVHLLAIPWRKNGLAKALGRTHNDYARWLNLRRQQVGHAWQNRFYSCPLDEVHGWAALRYIELNPVRAGLVINPADWPWSSATVHLGGPGTAGLVDLTAWRERWTAGCWEEALRLGPAEAALQQRIREATRTGRPVGSEQFVRGAEALVGRSLVPKRRGPRVKGLSPMQIEVV